MKKFLIFLILIGGLLYYYKEETISFFNRILESENKIVIPANNEYKINNDFLFVQNTNNFVPKNKSELINIYYTAINSGWNEFSFYCPKEYPLCIEDVKNIANDKNVLSHINNFVHPYNSYSEIKTRYTTTGKVTVSVIRLYSEEKINIINSRIDEFISIFINDNMTNVDKIRLFHDFIINNSDYDSDRANNNIIKYSSDTAYGVLFEGYGLCSGYTDTMAIFLDKLGIKNYKIATDSHVWNYLYIDNNWYHIDVSWDDPVTSNKKKILDHTFFMINTSKLESLGVKDHFYDKNIYLEAK
jgi:hypothetical protein